MSYALVLRPRAPLAHAAFAEVVRGAALGPGERARTLGPPPRLGIPRLSRAPFALVLAEQLPAALPAALRLEAYRVETSVPLEGPYTGPGMVTLFRRRAGLDDATFIARWCEGHSPLALRVHPLVRYVRHRVLEALDGAPTLDGIVLEQTRERADLLRPWRFFGGALAMLPNMVRVGLDARGFLDLTTIENQLVEVSDQASR